MVYVRMLESVQMTSTMLWVFLVDVEVVADVVVDVEREGGL